MKLKAKQKAKDGDVWYVWDGENRVGSIRRCNGRGGFYFLKIPLDKTHFNQRQYRHEVQDQNKTP